MARTQAFDAFSEDYEKWFDEHQPVYESELKAVKHLIPDAKGGVEIGIGTGRFALPLGITTGVEPSKKMRLIALDKGLKVYDGIAEDLPFFDRSFDFALMVTTICFVDDIVKSFKEAHRILKEDGFLVVGYVDKNSPIGKMYLAHKEESRFYKDASFYSTDDVLDALTQTGFDRFEIVQTVFGKLSDITAVQHFEPGYGKGSFVAVKAHKTMGAKFEKLR